MVKNNQNQRFLSECEQIVKELDLLYKSNFDRLSTINLSERKIARIAQLLLMSREAAMKPIKNEIDQHATQNPCES